MSIPLGCRQCVGSGMVRIVNDGRYWTALGNKITAPEVVVLCDCGRGRAYQDLQGGDGTISGKMPVFDPMFMELIQINHEKRSPMDCGAGWNSI